jgi:hypothetical protein
MDFKKFVMRVLILILGLCTGLCGQAQTWAEWTRQKKTQIRYLLNQVAANKVYLEYLQQGYRVAETGLSVVRHIKEGDFNLHQEFFGSLKAVNPAIRRYAKVAEMMIIQSAIIVECRKTLNRVKESKQFTPEEMNHCAQVLGRLLADCVENMERLSALVTGGEMSLTDAARLQRIDELYADMQDKWVFCSSFSDELHLVSMQRLADATDIQQSKIINGLK